MWLRLLTAGVANGCFVSRLAIDGGSGSADFCVCLGSFWVSSTKEFSYLVTPFLAWPVAGVLKFLINSLRARRFAFDLIGYGGLPSNHSAIVSSMATLIALKEGIASLAFGIAIGFSLHCNFWMQQAYAGRLESMPPQLIG